MKKILVLNSGSSSLKYAPKSIAAKKRNLIK